MSSRKEEPRNYRIELINGTVLKEVSGKTVLFCPRRGDFFGLNESGAQMIQALLETDFESAVQKSLSKFEVDENRLREDLSAMVDKMIERKLAAKLPPGN